MPHLIDSAAKPGAVTPVERGNRAAIVWLTGLPAAGKSTIARGLQNALSQMGIHTYVLDGDDLRQGLCQDLGFSPQDRSENLRRAGEVAAILARAGVTVLAAFVSPYRRDRSIVRTIAGPIPFLEVFVDCSVAECARRDPKGLYRRSRAGEVPDLTGVSAPYERPEAADVHLQTDKMSVEESVEMVLHRLRAVDSPAP